MPQGQGSTHLDALIERSLDSRSDDEALNHIGLLIDAAGDAHSATGIDRSFMLLDEIRRRELAPEHGVLTHYFAANAWSHRAAQRKQRDVWAWEQPEILAQILEQRIQE